MNELPPMTLLDSKVSSKELNMLKVLLPFVDLHFQPMLATYIKYMELRATIDLFAGGRDVFGAGSRQTSPDLGDIIPVILPYLTPEERDSMENMQNIINTMNMFEQYKDMLTPEMMSSFSGMGATDGDSDNSDSSDGSGSMDNMMSMFEMMSGMMS